MTRFLRGPGRAFFGAMLLAALPGIAAALDRSAPRDMAVQAYPLASFSVGDREQRVFGKLTFLGGLELRGSDPDFGGISSLLMEPDGQGFIALTDQSHWITGRIEARNEVPTGISAARIAPLIGPSGTPMKRSRYFDSEGLARAGNTLFVSVERTHDVFRFERGPGGLPGRGQLIAVPNEVKQFDFNRGMEAIGILPPRAAQAGRLIAFAERAPRAMGRDHVGFIFGPNGGRIGIRRIGDFDITDLSFLPGGDLVILERRFVALLGIGFRIRRFPIAEVRPGAMLEGETLIEADGGYQIDNMEALGVHRAADGRVILTVMSDNNFSILQRSLMLRFALTE